MCESFCYSLWSLLHYYPLSLLHNILSSSSLDILLTITLTDDSTNTRRAACSVLQEGIGRGVWDIERDQVNEYANDLSVMSLDSV